MSIPEEKTLFKLANAVLEMEEEMQILGMSGKFKITIPTKDMKYLEYAIWKMRGKDPRFGFDTVSIRGHKIGKSNEEI